MHTFACQGLRTLVMGHKVMKQQEVDEWMARYEKVKTSDAKDKEA